MNDSFLQQLQPIAYVRTDFATKFGVPRQSGLIDFLKASIVFEPEYRDPNAFRGLEGYSYLWVIWQFSEIRSRFWIRCLQKNGIRWSGFWKRIPVRPIRRMKTASTVLSMQVWRSAFMSAALF